MKKILILIVALLSLGTTAYSARPHLTPTSPYQHGQRWFFSVQGGPKIGLYDHIGSFFDNGRGWSAITYHGALSVGYNFSDAWSLRVSGGYSRNAGACTPYQGEFYPYTYNAAYAFADGVLDFPALCEINKAFRTKFYAGLGGAYTFGFSDPEHPFEVLNTNNFVPALRLGIILEYCFPGGFGLFSDIAVENFLDRYDGYATGTAIALDSALKLSFGVIWHFQNPRLRVLY